MYIQLYVCVWKLDNGQLTVRRMSLILMYLVIKRIINQAVLQLNSVRSASSLCSQKSRKCRTNPASGEPIEMTLTTAARSPQRNDATEEDMTRILGAFTRPWEWAA